MTAYVYCNVNST